MKDFAAIDFETANNERSSVCSVGIVIVRNGEIVDSFDSLIQPEPNYYNYWCSQVHGLCHEDTDDAIAGRAFGQLAMSGFMLPMEDIKEMCRKTREKCKKQVFGLQIAFNNLQEYKCSALDVLG